MHRTVDHRTLSQQSVTNSPCLISGCLRMRELGDWLRRVDELNDEIFESWTDPPGSPDPRAASDSTDDRGPAPAPASSGGTDVDVGGRTGLLHEVAPAESSERHTWSELKKLS